MDRLKKRENSHLSLQDKCYLLQKNPKRLAAEVGRGAAVAIKKLEGHGL